MKMIALAGLVAGGLLAGAPGLQAATFRITGQELTGETTATDADGSVRTVVQTGLNGLLYHVEENERVLAHALLTMSIIVNGDELRGAEVTYTEFGRSGYTVTIQIDPCWFEYVNGREATASEFGEDVVVKIEAAAPRAVEPCIKEWLTQRLAMLGAKTAEPFVKAGVTLVPPRR
jgi:hypothetical protein